MTDQLLLDEDGYPTQEAIDKVRTWDPTDARGLITFLKSIWYHPAYIDLGDEDNTEYAVSTAGWSGNETLIEALQENHIWWMLHWVESRRGGHYKFADFYKRGLTGVNND